MSAASLAGQARPAADEAVLAESLSCPDRFGELYSRYFAEIHRYLAGRLGPDAADDLAADTFLAAFGRRATFDPARARCGRGCTGSRPTWSRATAGPNPAGTPRWPGDFRIAGRTQVSGQPAIELTWSSSPGQAQGYVQYSTFEFLPPTVANQARLRVSVPAGYTRVAGPHAPGRTG